MNPDFGYNQTTGGNWNSPNEDVRNRLSEITKRRCSNPEYIRNISEKLKGHPVSQETRNKISEKAKGRKMPQSHIIAQRSRKHSPETIAKLRGHGSWITGLSKETDVRVKAISEKLTGRVVSESQKRKQSVSMKALYEHGYKPMWINDGEVETLIDSSQQIPTGYTRGRLNSKNVYVHMGNHSKKIEKSELPMYISAGWTQGRPSSVGDSIRKGKQKIYWRYEGRRFDSANELAAHLRVSGYPDIVGATITSLVRKGFSKSKKYKELDGKIEKVYI